MQTDISNHFRPTEDYLAVMSKLEDMIQKLAKGLAMREPPYGGYEIQWLCEDSNELHKLTVLLRKSDTMTPDEIRSAYFNIRKVGLGV